MRPVRLWDTKSQSTKPIQILDEARDSVSSLSILEHEIVSGSVDGRVRTYDMRMGMVHVDVVGRMFMQCLIEYTSSRSYETLILCPC